MPEETTKQLRENQTERIPHNTHPPLEKNAMLSHVLVIASFILMLTFFIAVTLLVIPLAHKHCSHLATTIVVVFLQMFSLYLLLELTLRFSSRSIPIVLVAFLTISTTLAPVLLWETCTHTNCSYGKIFASYIFVLFLSMVLALSFKYLDKKLFNPHLPIIQPIQTTIRNMKDYLCYWLRNTWRASPVKVFLFTAANVCAFLSLCIFFNQHSDSQQTRNSSWASDWITLSSLLIPVAIDLYLFVKNYSKRFNNKRSIDGIYDKIEPPEGWTALTLIEGNKDLESKSEKGKRKKTYAYFSEAIDEYLGDNKETIGIVRDRDYEKNLKEKIGNDGSWNKIFRPFLRQNFLDSIHTGKQFYNEDKYGLSHELDIKSIAENTERVEKIRCVKSDKNTAYVSVHQTCYFDSYLTNIIPGDALVNSRTERVIATTESLMPYSELLDNEDNMPEKNCESEKEPARKILLSYDQVITANEPGVTTLLFANDALILWTQNRLAQSSRNKIVASGSGSADWEDCKEYLKKNKQNGFRKAIVRGMQRELWEESHGDRTISEDEFMEYIETRITGYFRWLKKAGKAEFVGITRLRPDIDNRSRALLFSPELSEVREGKQLDARTMYALRQSLKSLEVTETDEEKQMYIEQYNVSCAMALYKLKLLCEDYCQGCLYGRSPRCGASLQIRSSTSSEKALDECGQKCTTKPTEALFEKNGADEKVVSLHKTEKIKNVIKPILQP